MRKINRRQLLCGAPLLALVPSTSNQTSDFDRGTIVHSISEYWILDERAKQRLTNLLTSDHFVSHADSALIRRHPELRIPCLMVRRWDAKERFPGDGMTYSGCFIDWEHQLYGVGQIATVARSYHPDVADIKKVVKTGNFGNAVWNVPDEMKRKGHWVSTT